MQWKTHYRYPILDRWSIYLPEMSKPSPKMYRCFLDDKNFFTWFFQLFLTHYGIMLKTYVFSCVGRVLGLCLFMNKRKLTRTNDYQPKLVGIRFDFNQDLVRGPKKDTKNSLSTTCEKLYKSYWLFTKSCSSDACVLFVREEVFDPLHNYRGLNLKELD